MKITIVMPVYNEVDTLKEIVSRVNQSLDKLDMEKEIVMVDDFSSDGTRDLLKDYEKESYIQVFYHEKNQGKGAALRTAFEKATGDVLIIQDADLEYDPAEYPKLLEPILDGRADVVYGSRFLGGGPHRVHLFWHYMGNQCLTLLSNIFSNINLTDMETCYKAFKREVIQGMKIRSNRFGFEPEFTMKIAKKKCHIYEVSVSYSGRDYEEGKKITWVDGVKAIMAILYFRFFD